MPLMYGKSKKAFEHNVEAEMDAGKPQNQSLAIAYAMKKRSKKMAGGGMVEGCDDDGDMIDRIMKKRGYSEGGMVANEVEPSAEFEDNQFDDLVLRDDLEQHYTGANSGDEIPHPEYDRDDDIINRIMHKRHQRNPVPA